ncbi:AaceriAGR034Wp [[Ashbya] aceris (nom. inval.)]|nr:AaceriAGR034Wp [[Ashbya] aceris (nom. inval.)]
MFQGADPHSTALLNVIVRLMPQELQHQLQLIGDDEGGVPDGYMDTLPRVPKKQLTENDNCAICCCGYLEDDYPLVVELPNCGHTFDLQCVSVWLSRSTTCPMCRSDVLVRKPAIDSSAAELEEDWGMYG